MIKKYEEQFAKAPHKNFVTGHAAFAYLSRDFGLEQNSVKMYLLKVNQTQHN